MVAHQGFLRRPNLPINSRWAVDHRYRFNFAHDLVLYLYQNGLTKIIEAYVHCRCRRVNSVHTPQFIGSPCRLPGLSLSRHACAHLPSLTK
jgi:hypothetical protein